MVLLAACAGTPAAAPSPVFYPAADSTMRTLPFSEAVEAGGMLYLSGQIGVAPGGPMTPVAGGIGPEATQALENIKAVLARHGSSMAKVVKCTAFLADMKEWPAFNEVYRRYFSVPYPARSAFGATGLALGARVEIECIAAR